MGHFKPEHKLYVKELTEKYSGDKPKVMADFAKKFGETISITTIVKIMKGYKLHYNRLRGWEAKKQKDKGNGIEDKAKDSHEARLLKKYQHYTNYFSGKVMAK